MLPNEQSNVERRIHCCACYNRSRLPDPTLGQDSATSTRFAEFASSITNRSNKISVRNRQRTIRLEQISFGTAGVQSRHLRRRRHTRIMGITRFGRMVPRPIAGPLPMRPVLRSRNESIQDIGIDQTVPTTLPGT